MSGQHTICPVCGNEYYRYPSQVKKGIKKVCSKACKGKIQSKGRYKACANCGESFWARASQEKQGFANYCSRECHFDARNTKQKFICICCGKEIYRTPYQISKGWTKFCSQDCLRHSQRRLSTHGGGRVNLFTNWQKREWRDDSCAKCGAKEDLQLDHKIPRFAGGKAERGNAQTLCRKCNREKYWKEDLPYYTKLYSTDVDKPSLIDLEAPAGATGRKQVLPGSVND